MIVSLPLAKVGQRQAIHPKRPFVIMTKGRFYLWRI